MTASKESERRRTETLSREELRDRQLGRLNDLLGRILPNNTFYAEKLSGMQSRLDDLDQLATLPYTFKDELLGQGRGGEIASNLTYPLDDYVRFHQTSGTRGRPMVVLDTAEDWQWWIDCWQHTLDAAQVTSADRAMMAFSFGPFIGFWSAHDAVVERGCLVAPGGGMSTLARLELMRASAATIVFCTPSYALHMAELGAKHSQDVGELGVRCLILAGEPGGSCRSTRQRIESLWKAHVVDHGGASEVGPWGFGARKRLGLHVLESEFIAEFISVATGEPAGEGELSELVLTNLGRTGMPVVRYRTGDLVRPYWGHDERCRFVLLEEGVVGRADDMMVIRGVNVFPTSVEQILRGFPEVVEYRLTARRRDSMDQLFIEIEDHRDEPRRVMEELRLRLGLRVDVACVEIGSLPRFEGKGSRFVDERQAPSP